MKACGVIVEYNPFHNGHKYHVNQAKKVSQADCIIAVMSGPFLQRGEPAIIDKFHRAKAALTAGVDLVLELPYMYAVQSSENFGKGAVMTLNEIGVSSICFGSESGKVDDFVDSYQMLKNHEVQFDKAVQFHLNKGHSFPKASHLSYEEIGLKQIDMFKPNNILGFSYVKTILNHNMNIKPLTIKRLQNDFHDKEITHHIASATSIRESLTTEGLTDKVSKTFPDQTLTILDKYKQQTGTWHSWDDYFPFLLYRIMTMSADQLRCIQGVDEGLEHRIKRVAEKADSFTNLMERMKTKRYTWTRLQRMFTHILTHTLKDDYDAMHDQTVPYIRLLGMTSTGQQYLNSIKKDINIPLITQLTRNHQLAIDEKASRTYYTILTSDKQREMFHQEISQPIII